MFRHGTSLLWATAGIITLSALSLIVYKAGFQKSKITARSSISKVAQRFNRSESHRLSSQDLEVLKRRGLITEKRQASLETFIQQKNN